MTPPWNLDDLEIVGYADVLKETMLPSVVPPVFRLKADAQRILLSPYSFNAGFLYNAIEIPRSELEELNGSREITLFDDAFPAHAGFELWVDESFQWHYQPLYEVKQELRRIAEMAIQSAEDALRRDDLRQAERLSGVAISADDRRVEPLAIKAAIRRIDKNKTGERLMAELAAPVLEERLFNLLVDHYCYCASRQQPAPAAPESSPRRRPMRGVACEPEHEAA
jgi:hypothetical protein